jgi:hypothetical protein
LLDYLETEDGILLLRYQVWRWRETVTYR